VVTDRNNIRKLLAFIDPDSAKNKHEPFTIKVEVVKETAILCRDETKTYEIIGPQEFRGYGHEFEKAYTTCEIKGSTGHHRIISYSFAGMKFIIRHETDAYLTTDEKTDILLPRGVESDPLSELLGSLTISQSKGSPSHLLSSKLQIKRDGRAVSLESTVEIKTRVAKKPLEIHEVAPQLWVSQTPYLVRAYYQNGTFQKPSVENVVSRIKGWEYANQAKLRQLAALIAEISTVTKRYGGKATVRFHGIGDSLEICKADVESMLPQDLYSKWQDVHDSHIRPDIDSHHGGSEISSEHPTTQPTNNGDVKIFVGRKEYLVNLEKMPYFISLQPSHEISRGHVYKHDDIPFFEVIQHGVTKGLRQIFRRMPICLEDYHVLCKSIKLLEIDVRSGRTLSGIMNDMRLGKSDWDPEERREIRGQKSLARDSAFRLAYTLISNEAVLDASERNTAYNAVVFVVSHRRIFKYRSRRIVREAFEERFLVSDKQRNGLDKWPVDDVSADGPKDDDETTADDDIYDFDSDYSL
jgi:hypothetical protein